MSLIKLDGIKKHYGQGENQTEVLDDITFEIKEGEFVGIMGPSGSGKSTLMNIVGLLDVSTGGTYEFRGNATNRMPERRLTKLRKKDFGFIFQNFNLLGRETVLDNIALPMVYNRIGKLHREKRAHELLVKVGLEERGYYRPTQLSGGQKQRVAIARALANKPRVVLADEPTGNLDTKTGKQIIKLLKELNREGTTIIMVTHDHEVANSADRVIQIVDGKLTHDTNSKTLDAPMPKPESKPKKTKRKTKKATKKSSKAKKKKTVTIKDKK